MKYWKRATHDYLGDTYHLSLLEHGAYTRLLDVYYIHEGAIPAEQATRLVGARTDEERIVVEAILAEFFRLVSRPNPHSGIAEMVWVHKRCEQELKLSTRRAQASRLNGAKGGRPRKQKPTETRENLDVNLGFSQPVENIEEKPTRFFSEPKEKPSNNLLGFDQVSRFPGKNLDADLGYLQTTENIDEKPTRFSKKTYAKPTRFPSTSIDSKVSTKDSPPYEGSYDPSPPKGGDRENLEAQAVPKPKPDGKVAKGKDGATFLPPDWEPTREEREYAVKQGVDPDRVALDFRDHWLQASGPNARKRNWHAAYQLWVRRTHDRLAEAARPRVSQQAPPKPGGTAADGVRRALADLGIRTSQSPAPDDFDGLTIDGESP